MNGFLLVLPILFIRYGLLNIISKEAARRADFFPPTENKEKAAFWTYEITTLLLLIVLFFEKAQLKSVYNYIGLGIYLLGLILYSAAAVQFASPNANGLNTKGLYSVSRNPMYAAFFLYFLGCSLLANSRVLISLLVVLQGSVHYLILSEERWCMKEFGEEYRNYMKQVSRYF